MTSDNSIEQYAELRHVVNMWLEFWLYWIVANKLAMSQRRKVATDAGLKALQYCEIQRYVSGGDQPNQQWMSSFGKGSKVADVRTFVYIKYCKEYMLSKFIALNWFPV